MTRTLSARQVLSVRSPQLMLEGEWGNCVGAIPRRGVVLFWGHSGNGKTTAVVSLCIQLTRFGKVLYCSIEEGFSLSFRKTLERTGAADCGRRFQVLDRCTIEELDERLSRNKSPEFIVVDSFQYLNIDYREYITFRDRHRDKLLIFVSHADGKQPSGRAARSVMYDADLKIWVEGYRAYSKGRFIGNTGVAELWKRGSERYYGESNKECL